MTKSFKSPEEWRNALKGFKPTEEQTKESIKYFMGNHAQRLSKKPTISERIRDLTVTIFEKIDNALS